MAMLDPSLSNLIELKMKKELVYIVEESHVYVILDID